MKINKLIFLAPIALALSSCAITPAETEHRVVLQLRTGAGGGNPNRIDMVGHTSRYVDRVSATPLGMEDDISMRDPSVAYFAGGKIPDGMKFVVTQVNFFGTAAGDSNGHGEFILQVGDASIANVYDVDEPTTGVWTGLVEVEAGDESTVFLEIANSSVGDAEILGYLTESERELEYLVFPTPDDAGKNLPVAELYSRRTYKDYEKCTFSFAHGVRDDPDRAITRNNWDLQYGNGGDVFHVTMVTDDRSKLIDLGELTWMELSKVGFAVPRPYAVPTRDGGRQVKVGHIYLVRSVDSDSDHTALFRVENLIPGDRVQFTWLMHNQLFPSPAR